MKYFAFIGVFFFSVTVIAVESTRELAIAQQSYAVGNFKYARATAQELNTADGYALACQTGLVIGGLQEIGSAAVTSLQGALADCRKALDLDPTHYSAGLSHAIATGFEGLRLRKTAYAQASKREIEALIRRYPDNAFAVGAAAGWHAAVAREGLFARLLLGAGRGKAGSLYAQAILLPNAELPLHFEYSRFLAAGNKQDKANALRILKDILAKPPQNALEKILLEKCLQIQTALRSGDKKSISQALAAATPFGGIDAWGSVKKTGIKGFPLQAAAGAP